MERYCFENMFLRTEKLVKVSACDSYGIVVIYRHYHKRIPSLSQVDRICVFFSLLLIEIIKEHSNSFKCLFRLVFYFDSKLDFRFCHTTQISQRVQSSHQTDALS